MARLAVDKRADAVIRWLERMKKSYRSGAVESAYMDAECARADLEDLRSDVFAGMNPVRRSERLESISRGIRTVFLAAVIVLTTVAPLWREADLPVSPLSKGDRNVARVLASPAQGDVSQRDDGVVGKHNSRGDEMPIVIVRETEVPPVPAHDTKPRKSRKSQPQKPGKSSQPQQAAQSPTPKQPAKTVAYDKVYSLVQTGQRALKNDNSVIKLKGVTPTK